MADSTDTVLGIILDQVNNTETLIEIILDDIANELSEPLPSKVGFGPNL